MTLNVAKFASPDEPLPSITTAVANHQTSYNAFVINPALHAAVAITRKALLKSLNRENKYVDKIAGGDGGVVDMSGFNKTSADSTPAKIPVTPTVDSSSPEGKGHYYVHVIPQVGNSFLFVLSSPGTIVTKVGNMITFKGGTGSVFIDTHPTADLTGLTSGDQNLQVASFNRAGMSELCAPSVISVP